LHTFLTRSLEYKASDVNHVGSDIIISERGGKKIIEDLDANVKNAFARVFYSLAASSATIRDQSQETAFSSLSILQVVLRNT